MNTTMTRWVGKTSQGFTIVELLIVVVVIAILAAITIVAYNGIQQRATVATLSSDLGSAAKALEVYKIKGVGYPDEGSFSSVVSTNGATSYQYQVNNSASPPTFCVTGTYRTTTYFITNQNMTPKLGACAGHGVGGVPAITNLALHPRATAYSWTATPKWQNDRWGADGVFSLISGQIPPIGTDLTTAVRFLTNVARVSHGFHIAGNPEGVNPGTQSMPVSEGQTLTISLYVRWTGASNPLSYNIGVRPGQSSDNTWTGSISNATPVALTSGQWSRLTYTYTVPAGSDRLAIYARGVGVSDSIGDTHDATGLMVVNGSTVYAYTDGSSPGWIWNGAANTSTSTGPPSATQ